MYIHQLILSRIYRVAKELISLKKTDSIVYWKYKNN